MLRDAKDVIGLVGAFYESAACPERWTDFLHLTARRMDCDNAILTLHDDGLARWNLQQSADLPSAAIIEYNTYYGAINPTIAPLFENARRTGSWCGLSRSLTGEKEYKKSEYYNDFGRKYGVVMKENGLFARAVFVVDKNDNVAHVEYVKEVANQPDYEAALNAARKAASA